MTHLLLGLDIGTSVVKAALFDRQGRERASAACRTTTLSPLPAWSEADPDQLWAATCDVVTRVLATSGSSADEVAAIGMSGAMVGAWVIDAAGVALRPGILWNDGRTQRMIEAMIAEHRDLMSGIFAVSGSVMQQGCTLPLLRWLKLHEPAVLAKAHAVFGAKDYIRGRLTGAVATDITEAAVAPGSAVARGRSAALISRFELEDVAHLLPVPRLSESIAGVMTEAASRATGLRAGTPVAIGAGDVACSVIGAGGLTPGAACSILGTTCLNGIVSTAPVFTPPDLGLLFTLPGGLWLRTMVNVAGTSNIDWLLAALCPELAARDDPYGSLAALAADAAPGADGAVYVPYLSEVGIIAPVVAPAARGGFVGLTPRHRRPALIRAVYEGVAFAIRDCFATIGKDTAVVRLVGGGARSAFWRQLIADVLGRAVEVPVGDEFGAKGAALLAGTAIGWFPSLGAASTSTCEILHHHAPQANGLYDAAFARYQTYAAALAGAIPDRESNP